jgi:hypothetical protein
MSQTHEYSLKKDFADPLSEHHTPSGLVGYFEEEVGHKDVNFQFADNFDKKA